jgi:hypothetical protein
MTWQGTVCIASLVLLGCSAAHGQQQPAPASADMFCLALRLVANPTGADPARWGAVHHPPDTVALDRVPVQGQSEATRLRLRPTILDRREGWRPPFWLASGDSLEMVWNDGLTGVRLRGLLKGGEYNGEASLVTDAFTPEPLPNALAEGSRVECPARFR